MKSPTARNPSLAFDAEALVYRSALGKVRRVPYQQIERVEILSAPTMHVAQAAVGPGAGAVGAVLGAAVDTARSKAGERVVHLGMIPVRLQIWITGSRRATIIPVDNLRRPDTLAIVPWLIARGVPADAITEKIARKKTLAT